MRDKFFALLGFCAKSRNCVFGEDAGTSAIKSGKAALVLLQDGASENTRKKISAACAYRQVPLLICEGDIGTACGKPGRKIITVTDRVFAGNLSKLYGENTGD